MERVWEVLADTARYPEWNPFIVWLHGELAEGSAIRFKFRIPPAPRLPGRATVLVVEPGVELRWAGHFLSARLFRAEHYHRLLAIGGGRTHFIHGERFSGFAAKLAWPLLRHFAGPVYARFNEALKDRVAGG